MTCVSTYLGFLEPAFNAFFLLALSVPSVGMLMFNLLKEEDGRVRSLGKRSVSLWVLAVFCWVNDRLLCDVWHGWGFPYLHGLWHVLIFLASYTGVVLFAYFDVKNHYPHEEPVIRYWPSDNYDPLAIPYVQLKSYHANGKQHSI
jgi:alkaline ceramidase